MNTISGEGIKIVGAVFLRVAGVGKEGNVVETAIMAYVTDSTKRFYLSKHAMQQLGVIGEDFHTVHTLKNHELGGVTVDCGCPRHTKPPPLPDKLPFPAIPENAERMRQCVHINVCQ